MHARSVNHLNSTSSMLTDYENNKCSGYRKDQTLESISSRYLSNRCGLVSFIKPPHVKIYERYSQHVVQMAEARIADSKRNADDFCDFVYILDYMTPSITSGVFSTLSSLHDFLTYTISTKSEEMRKLLLTVKMNKSPLTSPRGSQLFNSTIPMGTRTKEMVELYGRRKPYGQHLLVFQHGFIDGDGFFEMSVDSAWDKEIRLYEKTLDYLTKLIEKVKKSPLCDKDDLLLVQMDLAACELGLVMLNMDRMFYKNLCKSADGVDDEDAGNNRDGIGDCEHYDIPCDSPDFISIHNFNQKISGLNGDKSTKVSLFISDTWLSTFLLNAVGSPFDVLSSSAMELSQSTNNNNNDGVNFSVFIQYLITIKSFDVDLVFPTPVVDSFTNIRTMWYDKFIKELEIISLYELKQFIKMSRGNNASTNMNFHIHNYHRNAFKSSMCMQRNKKNFKFISLGDLTYNEYKSLTLREILCSLNIHNDNYDSNIDYCFKWKFKLLPAFEPSTKIFPYISSLLVRSKMNSVKTTPFFQNIFKEGRNIFNSPTELRGFIHSPHHPNVNIIRHHENNLMKALNNIYTNSLKTNDNGGDGGDGDVKQSFIHEKFSLIIYDSTNVWAQQMAEMCSYVCCGNKSIKSLFMNLLDENRMFLFDDTKPFAKLHPFKPKITIEPLTILQKQGNSYIENIRKRKHQLIPQQPPPPLKQRYISDYTLIGKLYHICTNNQNSNGGGGRSTRRFVNMDACKIICDVQVAIGYTNVGLWVAKVNNNNNNNNNSNVDNNENDAAKVTYALIMNQMFTAPYDNVEIAYGKVPKDSSCNVEGDYKIRFDLGDGRKITRHLLTKEMNEALNNKNYGSGDVNTVLVVYDWLSEVNGLYDLMEWTDLITSEFNDNKKVYTDFFKLKNPHFRGVNKICR